MKLFQLPAILLGIVMLFVGNISVHAQQIPFSSSSTTDDAAVELSGIDNPDAVRALVSRLSDNEVRDLLLQQLDVVAASQKIVQTTSETSLFELVTTAIPISVGSAVKEFPSMMSDLVKLYGVFIDSLGPNGLLKLLGAFTTAIAAGALVEFLVRRLTSDWRAAVNKISSEYSLVDILKLLSRRFILDLSGLLAFIIVSQYVLKRLVDPQSAFIVHHLLWNVVIIPRLFSVALRFAFAPNRADLRLIHTTDSSAKFLHRHLVGVALLIGAFLSVLDLDRVPGGENIGPKIGFLSNLTIHLYFAFIAWQSRFALIDIISGKNDEATPIEKKVATLYPYYALLVVVSVWILVEVLVARGHLELVSKGIQYSTMFILLLAPVLDTVVRGLVKHLTPSISGEGRLAQMAYESTKRSYIRIGRLLVVLFVLAWLMRIWSIDLVDLNATDLGAIKAQKFIGFIVIVSLGYLCWEIVTLWLNHKLAAEKTASGASLEPAGPGGDGGGPGGSRLSTVLPLITWFIQAAIIIVTTLMALDDIGVDTTPLLAGAGIVGLAIGFGAQKLVTDIVSGLFFLIDDAFRAGEYVNVEGTMGTVERISLRAMQLRHHRGPVHTIPYGEIPKITNYSRDWTIMKLQFTVPFETDLIKVKRIFKQIGLELLEHPEYGNDFFSPFKSQGVVSVDDVGIVIRGKFMVKPGKQFAIRKEIFQRVQRDFEASGIQFARKEVRVKLDKSDADDVELSEEDKRLIGAAASEASEEHAATDSSESKPGE